jgi:hypothetical protein
VVNRILGDCRTCASWWWFPVARVKIPGSLASPRVGVMGRRCSVVRSGLNGGRTEEWSRWTTGFVFDVPYRVAFSEVRMRLLWIWVGRSKRWPEFSEASLQESSNLSDTSFRRSQWAGFFQFRHRFQYHIRKGRAIGWFKSKDITVHNAFSLKFPKTSLNLNLLIRNLSTSVWNKTMISKSNTVPISQRPMRLCKSS